MPGRQNEFGRSGATPACSTGVITASFQLGYIFMMDIYINAYIYILFMNLSKQTGQHEHICLKQSGHVWCIWHIVDIIKAVKNPKIVFFFGVYDIDHIVLMGGYRKNRFPHYEILEPFFSAGTAVHCWC